MSARAGIVWLVAPALVLAAGMIFDIHSTLAAYLVAWIALGAIPIGALGILMMSYLVRWTWTAALRPILLSATAALPLVALLFMPMLLWMASVYPAAADPTALKPFKAVYLAPWFFGLRTIVYFTIWSLLALWLRQAGTNSDRMTRAAAIGLIVYALTVSLAGVDWLESIEPDFHSSIYGLLFLSFSMLNGLAFAIAGGLLSRRRIGSRKAYSALLLSMILVWAYLHAMQYLVIWSGNIPDEVTWYLKRSSHGWQVVLAALSLGQFIFPFFALLIERIRGDRNWLLGLCALTLLMRCVEAAVLVLPPLDHLHPVATCLMLVAGLLFVAASVWKMFDAAFSRSAGAVIPVGWLRGETGSK
jgi:hypothetical protein